MDISLACIDSVTSLDTIQEDYAYDLSVDYNDVQLGPTFSLTTQSVCPLVTIIDVGSNNVWKTWSAANFDFFADCEDCDGKIKIKRPADIAPYLPETVFTVRVQAGDEQEQGNIVESFFTLTFFDETVAEAAMSEVIKEDIEAVEIFVGEDASWSLDAIQVDDVESIAV